MLLPLVIVCAQGAPDLTSRFEVAKGLVVSEWAGAPQLAAPTAIDIDWRGRVWVAERGGRLSILEDADMDGRCESVKPFWEEASGATIEGLAVIGESVYASTASGLWSLVDGDGDERADSEGVRWDWTKDRAPLGRGVVGGPDGRRWSAFWDERTRPVLFGARTWLTGVEQLPTGAASALEFAFDSFGGLLLCHAGAAAGTLRVEHAMPSLELAATLDATGRELGIGDAWGLVVYESNVIEGVENQLLIADHGAGVVRAIARTRVGAGVEFKPSLLLKPRESGAQGGPTEPLRPTDVAVGLDGSVFVADEGGRILRIAPANRRMSNPRLGLGVVNGELGCLLSPAVNVRATGFELLAAQGEAIFTQLQAVAKDHNPLRSARALWVLALCGDRGQAYVREFLSNDNPDLRTTAYRALCSAGADSVELGARFVGDPSPAVRAAVLCSLHALEWDAKRELVLELMAPWPTGDRAFVEALAVAAGATPGKLLTAVGERAKGPDGDVGADQLAALTQRLAASAPGSK